jgi:hypothetical protein
MHYGGSRATRCMRDECQLRHECARLRHRSVALGEDRIVLHRSTRIARNVHLRAIVAVNGAESLVAAARVGLGLRFRGSNHIGASIDLVLRSALLRASRRTATSEGVLAAILRDGASRLLQDEVCGFKLHPPDPIGFMEPVV